eukprot:scpid105092/ scgid22652/ 
MSDEPYPVTCTCTVKGPSVQVQFYHCRLLQCNAALQQLLASVLCNTLAFARCEDQALRYGHGIDAVQALYKVIDLGENAVHPDGAISHLSHPRITPWQGLK